MSQLYFDHAASAPRRVEVAEAMAPWMHGVVGNPSGSHRAARAARRAVEDARDVVGAFCGVAPGGVVFTAGGTESCTLAVTGVARAHRRDHDRTTLVVSAVEHHAVLDAAHSMAADFASVAVREIGVDVDGVLDVAALHDALDDTVALVSVMAVNNETGVVQPLDAVVAAVAERGGGPVVTHSDAVAAAPWLDLATGTEGIDAVSLCGHKLGGPVNSGALVLRHDVDLVALMPGGGQERGRRGGTLDVAACVGLAAAIRCVEAERRSGHERVRALQGRLRAALSQLPGARVTAAAALSVPGTVHVTFAGLASDELLFLLDQDGVCASAAASCSSGASVSSHVLAAMGVAPERARGSLRLSMGHETSDDDVDAVIAAVTRAVERLERESGSRR
ncbi:MAG: aminotransferase class V-fold PLP-dependent enzyme [Acidobacteriota bacterium]|nr:aminotransferase class V-fold PLP-dependent enzyme [Acidobacteriota bacterium]MDE3147207.1 aminotransferase class V-fold PLP-dependent enzyme [Acidobacteriota bacterium]